MTPLRMLYNPVCTSWFTITSPTPTAIYTLSLHDALPISKTYPGRMPADTSTTTAADSAPAQAAPDLRIQVAPGASMPTRAHTDDAGLDLASAEDLEIPPGGRALVASGLDVAPLPSSVG